MQAVKVAAGNVRILDEASAVRKHFHQILDGLFKFQRLNAGIAAVYNLFGGVLRHRLRVFLLLGVIYTRSEI